MCMLGQGVLARPQAQSGGVWGVSSDTGEQSQHGGVVGEPSPSQGWNRIALTTWRLNGAEAGLSAGLGPLGLGSRRKKKRGWGICRGRGWAGSWRFYGKVLMSFCISFVQELTFWDTYSWELSPTWRNQPYLAYLTLWAAFCPQHH